MTMNLYAAWIGLFLAVLSGVISGLFFHDESWLGGYATWPRRLTRLGHISLFGLGFINLAFFLTAQVLEIKSGLTASAILLIIGAATMPTVCYLAAFRKPFRHLFFVPVLSVGLGITIFLWRLVSV
jgi:hypothetical protein